MKTDQFTQLTASVKELTALVQEAIKAQKIEEDDLASHLTKRWMRREGLIPHEWENMPRDGQKAINEKALFEAAFPMFRRRPGEKDSKPIAHNGVLLLPRERF